MSENIENSLQSLVNLSSKKFSRLFTFTSKTSEFTTRFKEPIRMNQDLDYEAALQYFSTFNTIFNITTALTNNQFVYSKDNGVTWKTITFPDGGYEINQINEELKRQLIINGDTTTTTSGTTYPIDIGINLATTKTILTLATNYQVDFTKPNTIGNILGFNSKTLSSGINYSDEIAKITNITAILIICDLITGHYIDGVEKNVIYSFPAYTVPVGYKINIVPTKPIYLPVNVKDIISVYIKIVDEDGKTISFNGEEISISIHLRQV